MTVVTEYALDSNKLQIESSQMIGQNNNIMLFMRTQSFGRCACIRYWHEFVRM